MRADDPLFEKGLARQLRNRAQGNQPQDRPAVEGTVARGACPDAEMLAAYHEGTLESEEMNACKEHMASCARCQEILSLVKATDEPFAAAGDSRDSEEAVRHTAVAHPVVFAASATAESANTRRRRRGIWIAPAGAMAAALLLWFGVHMRTTNKFNERSPQMAENRDFAPAVGPAGGITDSGRAWQSERKAGAEVGHVPGGAVSGKKDSSGAGAPKALAQKRSAANEPVAMAPRVSAGTSREPDTTAAGTTATLSQEATPSAVAGTVETQDQAQAALTTDGKINASPAATGARPAVRGSAAPAAAPQEAQKAQRESAAAGTAIVPAPHAAQGAANLRMVSKARATDAHVIPAPGGNVIWRVGAAGLIEQSTNGGTSWTKQSSGVTADLHGGSAPSEAVCWIVGGAGVVLQTIDGGAHWTKLVAPVSGELRGIRAADAQHATVWDGAEGDSFATSDGGVSWVRVTH